MTRHCLGRLLAIGAAALVTLGLVATPAQAQTGSLAGKVVNVQGRPQGAVPVVLDQVGGSGQKKTVTDNNGEWVVTGLPADTKWMITVVWGKLSGRIKEVTVKARETGRTPQMVISEGGLEKAEKAPATSNLTADEAAARNKKQEELQALFKEANGDIAAGKYDEAIAKITKIAAEIEKCAICYSKIGDAYLKKGDAAEAEKAYLQAIAADATIPDPFAALATLYNQQQKFDKAAEMSGKANELLAAKGGGDAGSLYNEGVILWNAGKGPEAQVRFEKAIALDPKMAEAHYLLGMTLVNQNKLQDAKKAFQEYLKLAPTGPNAETAKAILATIK
jgi:tetratricopeptide (TPR) repeat protein